MKTKIYVFFFAFILFLSFFSAIEFTIKEEVLRGENLVVQVTGEFVKPLTKENIHFYKRHLSTSIEPYGLEKINGDYFIYAKVPFEKEVDDYSIWLEGVEYYSGIGTSTEDLFANFSIVEGYASFSLNPGIIQTSENYFIEIKSLSDSTITINYGDQEKSFLEINQSFEIKESFLESLFGSSGENITNTTYEEITEWTNSVELKPGEAKILEFPIESFVGLKKIKFNYEDENYDVLVFIDGSDYVVSEAIKNLNESINWSNENSSKFNLSEINVTILDNGTVVLENTSNPKIIPEDCSEWPNSTFCGEEIPCDGDFKMSQEGLCCFGECIEEEKTNTGKTIGWILIITIVLFLTWFFKKKYRGAKPPAVDLEKESKGKKK